ncbi:peptidyl-prolyl cis trans isomerase [Niveomyces insectorum RCEF 264]|uniref:Peptidyl-prolyl cis-trans isomerase-like 2 n=1 Tax=Niveomyces insectorum RCEF 264 TaxID=1081102 RepID=A0A167QWY6_9HYPO|nr:peptidyl-prolyl cis trans isomerase [Niveomyces insectorum RCEF 264]
MGKGTDKLYITHSEWASSDAFSASKGAAAGSSLPSNQGPPGRRLPFNYCAASLQPFVHPVCTPDGIIFDAEAIAACLAKKPGRNPVTGAPLRAADLIRLNFARNGEGDGDGSGSGSGSGDYIDPVTFKVFTEHTHIVALRHGTYANVFAWDTVERMNIKPKMWRDLVDDEPFTRKDIITLQDPLQVGTGRDVSQGGTAVQQNDNTPGDGRDDKVRRAREAVEKARRARTANGNGDATAGSGALVKKASGGGTLTRTNAGSATAAAAADDHAAVYTTGRAAASFTSTGLTPETSSARAVLSDEEWLLRPRRVKLAGYARLETNLGALNVALHTEHAPRAVWNFVRLAQRGAYRGVVFHRNLRGFMIQGGDPTGTGRGGTSIWGTPFADEVGGPLTHSGRGVVSMANKGKDTNTSQFFITYRAAKHLDRKHTIFGQVVGGLDVLDRMEAAPVDKDRGDRPVDDIVIQDVVVYLDPFAEFLQEKRREDEATAEKAAIQRRGGTDDDKLTWTGKRVRGAHENGDGAGSESAGVGKYLKTALKQQERQQQQQQQSNGTNAEVDRDKSGAEPLPLVDPWEEPAKKKIKSGGFGNFDSW